MQAEVTSFYNLPVYTPQGRYLGVVEEVVLDLPNRRVGSILLARTSPKDEKASRLVKYLLNNRKHATYWNSTRDTAICIEAMADYLKASGEDTPDMTIEVWLDGKKQKEVKIALDKADILPAVTRQAAVVRAEPSVPGNRPPPDKQGAGDRPEKQLPLNRTAKPDRDDRPQVS